MTADLDLTDRWLSKIRESFEAEDMALTQSLLDESLQETNSSPKLMEVAGMIAYSRGDFEESIRLIEEASFQIVLTLSGQLTLANAWLRQGQTDSAKTTLLFLAETIERVPSSMLPDLTHGLAKLGEFEAAISVCRNAFDRHPDDDNAVFGVAFYMHRAGYPSELVYNVMAKAVQMDPNSDLYRLNISILSCSLNRFQEAYTHACRLSPARLKAIPCACMKANLLKLFIRFGDSERIALVNHS